jgi:hypothetical protein
VLLGEGTRDKADLRSTKQLSCLGSHSSEVGQLRETRTISFPRISQSSFVSFAEHRPTLLIIRITASSISNGVGGTDLTWTLSRVGSLFLRHKHCQLLSIRAAERQAPDSLIGPRAQQKTTKKKGWPLKFFTDSFKSHAGISAETQHTACPRLSFQPRRFRSANWPEHAVLGLGRVITPRN